MIGLVIRVLDVEIAFFLFQFLTSLDQDPFASN